MEFPVEDALRYLGAANADTETRRIAEETADMLARRIRPRYVWRSFRIVREKDGIVLPEAGIRLPGTLAGKMLAECGTAALLACTLGAVFDRMEKEWETRDMARAAVLDACGSAWTEAGCDEAEKEIGLRFPLLYRTDRFSPGYGDLPLELQADFLRALDAGKRLGISANESSLLTPRKSVTAVIGLSDQPQKARIRGCAFCGFRERCEGRKRGNFCEV